MTIVGDSVEGLLHLPVDDGDDLQDEEADAKAQDGPDEMERVLRRVRIVVGIQRNAQRGPDDDYI